MFDNYTFGELLKLFAPLLIIELILIIICLRSIIKDQVNYLPKWAWALIVIFVNLLGAVIYLIIGRKRD
ncbi:MAG: PLD nuclease N-terminal domain-containing protein [Bacillota bacterium]|nr:PLD nuclease N-terminal domain-containing protein [Bacillota bacterium]